MRDHNIHPLDVILHKRDGRVLTPEEIQAFIHQVVEGAVTDARIASWLMAIFQRGLNQQELHSLTEAMRFSGEVFNSAELNRFTVDKHSTGGVGDKTSLLIAPIAAAAGLAVPMISGRSLGHTGGTLDKLETIPGYNTQLSLDQFADVIRKAGASIIGQTKHLVPADRILYALRDHTGTVESPNLICASIMSKKLAAGLNALVLDVKTGSGAFMKDPADSEHLARLMVTTGEASQTTSVAILTDMSQPLGRFSGNWVEVWECLDILQNRRHPLSADLIQLTNILCGWMLYLGSKASSPEEGAALSDQLLTSGEAWKHWLLMTEAQGANASVFQNPETHHKPTATRIISAPQTGYFASIDCTRAGWAVQRLGAGREKPGDPVSAHAGLEMHAKLGDHLEKSQPFITLFSADESLLDEPEDLLLNNITFADTPPQLNPLIRKVITKADL